ncbi:ketopantoate reductase family protein [Streptomyces sp. NBRC 109706]|uniref:ketopantoate reductase family protein n=1 Tax=Streptomyces sp. NBRC 109706 TaxID=1550035 RepID=UPI000784ADD1|nr:2-dehydropantoate 2-reductase N-terminal domain-containing protein [Streptomyces sp. NBRC 109706]
MTRRYVVIGAGAVGGALAADLLLAGIPAVLSARGAALDAIRARGLVRVTPAGRRTVPVPVVGGPAETELTPDDVLLLATKAQDAQATLADWAWRPTGDGGLAADLPVITLQNGLDAERVAARWFGNVIGATVLVPARHLGPGEVLTAAAPRAGQLLVGGLPFPARPAPPDPAAVAFVEDADAAGWLAQGVPDASRWKAWKLLHNVTNAVELFTGAPEELAAVGRRATAEARTVLTAAGHTVADPETERTYDPALATIVPGSGHVQGQQSTWQSFERGASSEVDFLNGEISLLGRLHGVPTPVNSALQRVLGVSASAGEKPGSRDIAEVLHTIAALAGTSAPTEENTTPTQPTGAARS